MNHSFGVLDAFMQEFKAHTHTHHRSEGMWQCNPAMARGEVERNKTKTMKLELKHKYVIKLWTNKAVERDDAGEERNESKMDNIDSTAQWN